MSTHAEHGDGEEHGLGHVVSPAILYSTGMALLVMTVITVAVRYVDAGEMNMPIALGIAGLKATLVALFFMHLRWDRPFNAIIFVTSIFLAVLLMIFALMDTGQYEPDVFEGNPDDVQLYLDVKAPAAPITADKQID
ncbi:MAG: cytochrome C oxidase subunit IV family protein [Phycisphaerales bacterium]|nr:cytochrome C oxidase subunit IV family protein [Phycisphaerales bacterium]